MEYDDELSWQNLSILEYDLKHFGGKKTQLKSCMFETFRLDWSIIWVSWDIGYMVEHLWNFQDIEHGLHILEYFAGICFGHIKT